MSHIAKVSAATANVEKRADGYFYVDGLKVSTAKLFRSASPLGESYKAANLKADKADMTDEDIVAVIRWAMADSAVGLATILAE